MQGLPERFPRQSLHNAASLLEERIQKQIDITQRKIAECEWRGLALPQKKLEGRLVSLDEARDLIVQARRTLYFTQ